MRWCVIRHPDLGLAVVAEPSLVVHKPRGWVRVSEYTTDRESLRPDEYADAPDLDAAEQQPAEPAPDPVEQQPAAKSTKAPTAGKREN